MNDNNPNCNNRPDFDRDAYYGLVFRWYGIDCADNIAVFDSGYLTIPKRVFYDESEYRAVDAFMTELLPFTEAQIAPELATQTMANGRLVDTDDWHSDASRGLFVYDEIEYVGSRYARGYFRAASPIAPLQLKALPESIQRTLMELRFPLNFSQSVEIEVERYFVGS